MLISIVLVGTRFADERIRDGTHIILTPIVNKRRKLVLHLSFLLLKLFYDEADDVEFC